MRKFLNFLRDENGATAIEYGLIYCQHCGCDYRRGAVGGHESARHVQFGRCCHLKLLGRTGPGGRRAFYTLA